MNATITLRWCLVGLAGAVLAGITAHARTVVLNDGRVISNCEILTEDNLNDPDVRGRWPELIASPEWTVIRTVHGLWGFKNVEIKDIEEGPGILAMPAPTDDTTAQPQAETTADVPPLAETSVFNPEVDAPLVVQQIKGRVYNLTLGPRALVNTGSEIKANNEVRVTWNSRLRGTMSDRVTLGAMEGTNFTINRFYRMVRVGTEYYLDFTLTRGKIWLEVSERLSNIDRVRFTINGHQLLTTRPMLFNVQVTDVGTLQAAVFESKDVNIRFIIAGGEKPLPLAAGKRVEVSLERAEFGSELDDIPLLPTEIEEWRQWNAWEPQPLAAEPIVVRPNITGQGIEPYIAALPQDDPGRNSRSIRSVRFRGTFFSLRSYRAGLRKYLAEMGDFPPQNEFWMIALKENPGSPQWRGPYVESDLPSQDGWGNPFVYETWRDANGQWRADVRSVGPNGIDEYGFGDDLR